MHKFINKIEYATSTVQAALNRLVEWSSKWRFPLNSLKCKTFFFILDPYQSRIQPSVYILYTPLKFNLHPTFLGVTFDRTLSFKHYVLSLRKSFTADSLLSALSPLHPEAHQKNPYVPYIKLSFVPSLLTLIQAGFPSHLLPTSPPWIGCMHNPSSCRVITGCLSSTPIPLLHIEALLPPLRFTFTHQSLSFFERSLRLPSTFSLASLANSNPRKRLKKGSWRSLSRSNNLTPNLHLACELSILCHPNPPGLPLLLTPFNSTSHPHALAKTLHPFATPQLPPIFPPYPTAIFLPGLTVRYLAG